MSTGWALPWWRPRRPARDTEASDDATEAAADADATTQARFGGDDDETEWHTVYVAWQLEEAHVIRGALEAEDVPVMLRYDTLSTLGYLTASRGVRVQVPRTLVERAQAVVARL